MTLPSPLELSVAGLVFSGIVGLLVWAGQVRLAFYAGAIAAMCFTASGVAHTYKVQGVDEQKAEDEPIIKRANDRADLSDKLLAGVQADAMKLRNAYAAQDHGMAELQTEVDAANARAAAADAKGNDLARRYETARLTFAELISMKSKPEEVCANADSALRRLARSVRE